MLCLASLIKGQVLEGIAFCLGRDPEQGTHSPICTSGNIKRILNPLFFSLFLFLSFSLYICLSVCLSVCLFLHLDISIHFRLSSPMYSFYLSLSLFYRRRRVILGRSASRGPYPPPLISSFLLVIFWSRFSCLPFFGPRRYRRCRRHCF